MSQSAFLSDSGLTSYVLGLWGQCALHGAQAARAGARQAAIAGVFLVKSASNADAASADSYQKYCQPHATGIHWPPTRCGIISSNNCATASACNASRDFLSRSRPALRESASLSRLKVAGCKVVISAMWPDGDTTICAKRSADAIYAPLPTCTPQKSRSADVTRSGWGSRSLASRPITSTSRHTQLTYTLGMKASFVELPSFSRYRADYLDDERFRGLQEEMIKNPEAGDLIEGTGGLRKLRHSDPRRNKGKRGGLRVIYYWWDGGRQFWLFTLYDKDEMSDLSAKEKKAIKTMLEVELENRK